MDWLSVLDVKLALSNVRSDLVGDWYRDPWSWPEYESLITDHLDILQQRANASGLLRIAQIDVPKENCVTRPAVVLDLVDRVLYQALVDRQSKSAIGSMDSWVYGWRLHRSNPASGQYSPNKTEWSIYQRELGSLILTNSCGLKTDIVSCFASLNADRVAQEAIRRCGEGKVSDRLVDIILSFNETPGRTGLAQRSKASATLANMYLTRLDSLLNEETRRTRSRRTRRSPSWIAPLGLNSGGMTRWMDDFWVFGKDEADLRSMQLALHQAARDNGLELNIGKTAAFEGDALADAALRLQHSAIDGALNEDDANVVPLEELLDELTADPLSADRSSIHFALERMRRHRVDSRREALIEAAPRMPHGADHLARAFRDFGWWEDMQDWYLDYERSAWGKMRWSVANLGAMFPSGREVSSKIHDRFVELLMERPTVPLFALAAQRLASWNPDRTRTIFRSLLPNANHPLERRIIALAALGIGEEQAFIRSALTDYEENAITLKMIELRDYRPIRPTRDFAAASE